MDSILGSIPILVLAVIVIAFCGGSLFDDDDGGCDGGDGGD